MTVQETIDVFEKPSDHIKTIQINHMTGIVYSADFVKAFEMAIEALEKQIAKKPKEIHEKEDKYSSFYSLSFMCPSCETAVIFQPYKPKYCKHCGQRLDWK